MSPPDGVVLRDATPDDLPAIAALRDSVGWSVNEWALRAVIGRAGARCLVAADAGSRVVAVGSGIVYGPLGFVGNMIVAPTHRRRGLGSAILGAVAAFLDGAGCRRLELNATSAGRALYERHGFASIGRSATASLDRTLPLARDRQLAMAVVQRDDIEALATYDGPRFGGDRRALLELLLADPATVLVGARRDGALVGYACLRADAPRIGPLVADEPTIAESLLVEAFERLPDAGGLRLNLPPGNRPGAAWLRRLGVTIEPWDGRMAKGPRLPRREDTIYGMTVGALG